MYGLLLYGAIEEKGSLYADERDGDNRSGETYTEERGKDLLEGGGGLAISSSAGIEVVACATLMAMRGHLVLAMGKNGRDGW